MSRRARHPMWEFRDALDRVDIHPSTRAVGKVIAWILDSNGECYFGREYMRRHGIYEKKAARALADLNRMRLFVRVDGRRGPHGTPYYRFVPIEDDPSESPAHWVAGDSSESPEPGGQVTNPAMQMTNTAAQVTRTGAPGDERSSHSSRSSSSSSSSTSATPPRSDPQTRAENDEEDDMNKVITEAIQIYAHRRALRGATTNFDGYKLTVVREQTRDHLEAWHAMLRSSPADVTAEDLVQYMEAGTVPQERPVVGCEDCYWQVNHGLSRCPYADEPITAEEAAAIDAERSARRS